MEAVAARRFAECTLAKPPSRFGQLPLLKFRFPHIGGQFGVRGTLDPHFAQSHFSEHAIALCQGLLRSFERL